MDIKAIAEQVMAALGEAPEKIQEFLADPSGMIEQLTGHSLGEEDVAQVVDHIKGMVEQGGEALGNIDLGAIGEHVTSFFENNEAVEGIGNLVKGIFGK